MDKPDKSHKTQITIAAIGAISVLGGALFTNWDKIFGSKPDQPDTKQAEKRTVAVTEKTRYIISVYYYATRKQDAIRARKILEHQGYIVNTYPRGALNKGVLISKSYIYFKNNDYREMVSLREILSQTLNEDFSVHLSAANRADKTFRVVLVDGRT